MHLYRRSTLLTLFSRHLPIVDFYARKGPHEHDECVVRGGTCTYDFVIDRDEVHLLLLVPLLLIYSIADADISLVIGEGKYRI